MLLNRLTKTAVFKVKPYETVSYQDSYPDNKWVRVHITLDPVFYEKALDLRRNFKFSVSWFVSFAISNLLDEIVEEISNAGIRKYSLDNYHQNFVYIAQMYGKIQGFTTFWGLPEEKYLETLLI